MALDLSLKALRCVVALARERHFGRAAAACAVTQPALSSQIAKTERALGVPLFERSNKRVLVTPAGERLAREAAHILARVEALPGIVNADARPLAGRFRVGAIATLGPYLFRHVLGPLRQRYPGLDLRITEGRTAELLDSLKAGRLDAALLSPPFNDRGLELVRLFEEPFVLVAPAGHRLLDEARVRPSALEKAGMVLLEEGHCLREQVLALGDGADPPPARERTQAASLETLKHMVAAGGGFSLIPALAALDRDRLGGLVDFREFEDPSPSREIVLAHRAGSPLNADLEAFRDVVIAAMDPTPAPPRLKP